MITIAHADRREMRKWEWADSKVEMQWEIKIEYFERGTGVDRKHISELVN